MLPKEKLSKFHLKLLYNNAEIKIGKAFILSKLNGLSTKLNVDSNFKSMK